MSSGIFQVFNLVFHEDGEQISFHHSNEISIDEPNLIRALNGPYYIKMLYNFDQHKILILVQEEVFIVDIDERDKRQWLKYTDVKFNNTDPINKAILINNYLYILRKNAYLEKYHLDENSQLLLVKTINFNELKFLEKNDVLFEKLNITDFFIDDVYFVFLEKTSQNVFIFAINGDISNINEQNLKNISLVHPPFRVQIKNSKLFILVDGQLNIEYFLYEYTILKDGNYEYSDSYHIDYDYLDYHISDNYLFYSYDEYTTMIPHAFIYPQDLNRKLEIILNIGKIRGIEQFLISKDSLNREIENKYNFYTAAIGDHIGVLKVHLTPGRLICESNLTVLGEYFLNLRFYQVYCKNIENSCNTSDYFFTDKLFKIEVITPKNTGLTGFIFKENEGLGLGLIVGLAFSCLICLMCCLYVRKIKNSYVRYEETKDKNHLRIMSREEFDELEVNKKNNEGTV